MLQWVCFYIRSLSTWTQPGLGRCVGTVLRHHLSSSLQDTQSQQYSPKPERVSPALWVYNNSSPVQCPWLLLAELMGFWTAPRANGAEAQHSVFVHVEISHPEALECVLPTETNNFSLYTTVPSVCPVIYPFPVVPDFSQIQTCNSRHSAWSNQWLWPSN